MPTDLTFLLDELTAKTPAADRAILLSADGLLIAADQRFPRDDAEHLAAVAAGIQSLAKGVGERHHGGPVRQAIIQLETASLLLTAAGSGAHLAVLACEQSPDDEVDLGLVSYEMQLLATRLPDVLTSPPRTKAEVSQDQ